MNPHDIYRKASDLIADMIVAVLLLMVNVLLDFVAWYGFGFSITSILIIVGLAGMSIVGMANEFIPIPVHGGIPDGTTSEILGIVEYIFLDVAISSAIGGSLLTPIFISGYTLERVIAGAFAMAFVSLLIAFYIIDKLGDIYDLRHEKVEENSEKSDNAN